MGAGTRQAEQMAGSKYAPGSKRQKCNSKCAWYRNCYKIERDSKDGCSCFTKTIAWREA
ncbi:hypothetical protein LCGC14_1751470 [marine sediment metagenome]|uniref:Uncharacterized protein n=1 Tax=marine sediment metagenome TaxID=412755 RepID=A0A0F9H3M9_9ZZZZ